MADVEFFWDPVCPWAWLTSRWVAEVARQRDLTVDWRFICLKLVNAAKDYERDFPEGYIGVHTSGQKLLRVSRLRADTTVVQALTILGRSSAFARSQSSVMRSPRAKGQ